jgi:hypothetical protein
MNESCGSESIRTENIFHKHADWSGECVQRIVERHDAEGSQVREESV